MRAFFLTIAALSAQTQWPAQLEIDVKSQSWDAAARVGAAIVEEIDAGRMFSRFADVAQEAHVRRLYADALDHIEKSADAKQQRSIADAVVSNREGAPGFERRLANLKTSVLASEMDEPSTLPSGSVVVFWAEWCPLCKPELEAVSAYPHVVKFDVDRMNAAFRKYVPMAELPQLYVVDRKGHIRFHVAGFDQDGFFSRKLDWMIQAASRER